MNILTRASAEMRIKPHKVMKTALKQEVPIMAP
jgi:hypothetical protein